MKFKSVDRFKTEEEAVRIANATTSGLAGLLIIYTCCKILWRAYMYIATLSVYHVVRPFIQNKCIPKDILSYDFLSLLVTYNDNSFILVHSLK